MSTCSTLTSSGHKCNRKVDQKGQKCWQHKARRQSGGVDQPIDFFTDDVPDAPEYELRDTIKMYKRYRDTDILRMVNIPAGSVCVHYTNVEWRDVIDDFFKIVTFESIKRQIVADIRVQLPNKLESVFPDYNEGDGILRVDIKIKTGVGFGDDQRTIVYAINGMSLNQAREIFPNLEVAE